MNTPPPLDGMDMKPPVVLQCQSHGKTERGREALTTSRSLTAWDSMLGSDDGMGEGPDCLEDLATEPQRDAKRFKPAHYVFKAPATRKPDVAPRRVLLDGDEVVAAVRENFGNRPPMPGELGAFLKQRFGVSGLPKVYCNAISQRCFGNAPKRLPSAAGEQCRRLMEAALAENPAHSFSKEELLQSMQRIAQARGETCVADKAFKRIFKSSGFALATSGNIVRWMENRVQYFRLAPPDSVAPSKESKLSRLIHEVGLYKQEHPAQKPSESDIRKRMGGQGEFSKSTISAAIQVWYDYLAPSAEDQPDVKRRCYPVHQAGAEMLEKARSFILKFPPGYVVSHVMLERNVGAQISAGILQELSLLGLVKMVCDSPVQWVTTAGPDAWSHQARKEYVPSKPRPKLSLQTTVTEILQGIQGWMQAQGLTSFDPSAVQDPRLLCALGKLRTCLQVLREAQARPTASAAAALTGLELTLETLKQVQGLPNFDAEISGGLKPDACADAQGRTLSRSVQKLENYLQNMPEELKEYFSAVSKGSPARLTLANDQVHPPVASGEEIVQRLQSYLSELLWILLRTILGLQEVQAQYLRSGDSPCFDHVVLSANRKNGCEALMQAMGLDPAQASMQALPNGQQFRSWAGVNLMETIRKIIPQALEKVPPKHRTVLERHALKLLDRLPPRVAQSVSVHIPVNPKRHAELNVADIAKHLGLLSDVPPTGTKLPCIPCAAELTERNYEVGRATTVYASLLMPYERVKNYVQRPDVCVGTQFGQAPHAFHTGATRITRRPGSVSPPPKGVFLPDTDRKNQPHKPGPLTEPEGLAATSP